MPNTSAEQVAELLKDDGSVMSIGGRRVEEICEDLGARLTRDDAREVERYRFADGSVIAVQGHAAWDIGERAFANEDGRCVDCRESGQSCSACCAHDACEHIAHEPECLICGRSITCENGKQRVSDHAPECECAE